MTEFESKRFKHIQHNIGPMIYNTATRVQDSYKNTIRNILMYPMRTVKNYLQYYTADLFTLQEVQGTMEDNRIIDGSYEVVFNKTGSLNYLDTKSIVKIPHGCAVVYNKQRFKFITDYKTTNQELNNRSTRWIILEDKKTKIHYAVKSLHGLIMNPLTRYKRVEQFYMELTNEIDYLQSQSFKVIVGGDFNINIIKPNYSPFIKPNQEQKQLIQNELTPLFNKIIYTINKQCNIINDGTLITNYTYNPDTTPSIFMEALDYIVLSYSIRIIGLYVSDIKKKPTLVDINSTIPLVNDFDHSRFEVYYL
jgi:exonuclease III